MIFGSKKISVGPRYSKMFNLETHDPGVHELEMARNWELSGGPGWIPKTGGASGCRFFSQRAQMAENEIGPGNSARSKRAGFADRGSGQMFVVMAITVALNVRCNKEGRKQLGSGGLYSVTRNI